MIISVDYEHDRELGVNLGLVDGLGTALGTIGTGTAINGNVGFTPSKLLTSSGTIAQGAVTDGQGFTSATNGVKFGFVASNVTGFIRALETIGSTKILASPRILVLNKQRAEIQLGSRLGFQTLSQNFTSTIQQVQFLNTGTLLRLRPFVSDDGMVRMEIHPERSSGSVTNNIPNQQTAELTTNVMVPDGATLVIGGLIEDEDDFGYQGLPLLSRFPALGFLTGARQKTEGRRELVVLLTPHIWSTDQAMAHGPVPVMGPHALDGKTAADVAANNNTSPAPAAGGAAAADPPTAEASAPGQYLPEPDSRPCRSPLDADPAGDAAHHPPRPSQHKTAGFRAGPCRHKPSISQECGRSPPPKRWILPLVARLDLPAVRRAKYAIGKAGNALPARSQLPRRREPPLNPPRLQPGGARPGPRSSCARRPPPASGASR